MIDAARTAGCRMNFRAPIVRCESADTDLCRGGCPVMHEWRALLARRRPGWRAEAPTPERRPARAQQELPW